MVDPHAMSDRTANSAVGTPARRHTSLRRVAAGRARAGRGRRGRRAGRALGAALAKRARREGRHATPTPAPLARCEARLKSVAEMEVVA